MHRPADLPDYLSPPVTEVALSIQFDQLDKFRGYHIGLLWQAFKDELPTIIEQPALAPSFEVFGSPVNITPAVQFQFMMSPPMPRFWFMSSNEGELLQIQQDRLVYNWRERVGAPPYPRYEHVRKKIVDAADLVSNFFKESDLGEIKVNQAEVTYVNQIFLEDKDARESVGDVLSIWRSPQRKGFLSQTEDENLYFRYRLEDEEGKPKGRLHVTAHGVVRDTDRQPGLQLQLVARGLPRDQSVAAALEWFDYGRETIVRKFTDLTTKRMHRQWGRTDADD